MDENDEQDSSDDDPNPNCNNDDVTLSEQKPFYEHEWEEGFDLEYDTWLNRADHFIKSTSPTHIYGFSADEECLYAHRLEEGYDLTDPKYKAWLNIHHTNQTKPLLPSKHQLFSAEEALYAQRFEERYDLIDPKYEAWLSVHHPIAAATSDTMTQITGLRVFKCDLCRW